MSYLDTIVRHFSRILGKSQRSVASRRLALEPLEHRAMLSIATGSLVNTLAEGGVGDAVQVGSALQHQALAKLPAAAQQAIATEVGKLAASNGATGDEFGDSVSISGNTVVVGAPAADNGLGAAYVFLESGAGWTNLTQVATLTASDAAVGDSFGGSVSISGSTVVVGASNATLGANGSQGAAYVYASPLAVGRI